MSIKFFDENSIDADGTYTFTSSNTALAKFLYDNDRDTQLISIGSSDAAPEVWDIVFEADRTIDRIYIDNHNIKAGTLKYSTDGVTFASDFSTPISWSGNALTTNYYEFNSVVVKGLRLTMDTTIAVDDEKSVGSFMAFTELGEVVTNPSEFNHNYPEASVKHQTSKGGNVYVFFGSKFRVDMNFTDAGDTDMALFRSLKDSGTPFYVFPSGGLTTYTQEGFRIQDMYFCNYTNPFKPALKANLLGINTVINIILEEV